MKHLILVRHGESELNAKHRERPVFCGQIETNLTEEGRRQAIAVGQWISQHPYVHPTRAISSTLCRAVDTLHLIVAQLPYEVECLPSSAGLNERSLGEFEGKFEDDVLQVFPHYRHDDTFNKFRNDFVQKAPGGENLTEVTNRAWVVVEEFMQCDGDMILVSHYNPTRCIIGRALGLANQEIVSLRPKNATPIVLAYDGVFKMIEGRESLIG